MLQSDRPLGVWAAAGEDYGLAALLTEHETAVRAASAAAVVIGASVVESWAMRWSRRSGVPKVGTVNDKGNAHGSGGGSRSLDLWYESLKKPWYHPPSWVFPTVWLPLKALQAGALFYLWGAPESGVQEKAVATAVYGVHLALGSWWNALFFRQHRIRKSLYAMGGFYVTLAGAIAAFYRVEPMAAALLAPTQAWVTIAALLNYQAFALNPGADADA